MTSNLPMTAPTSTLDREITELSEVLTPRATDALPRCLKSLLAAGMVFPSSLDPEQAVEIYGYALAGLPAAGLRKVTEKLIRGELECREPDFLPKPPEMAILVRQEASRMKENLRRLQDQRETMLETQRFINRQPRTDEMKARIRDLVANTKRALVVEADGERHDG